MLANSNKAAKCHLGRLSRFYARAVLDTCRHHRIAPGSIELAGCHGQTIYHQGDPERFLPRKNSTHPQKFLERESFDPFADNE